MRADEKSHALEASAVVAACLLLLSLFGFRGKSSSRLACTRQVFVILAGMLGCNATDWIISYAAVTARDLYSQSSPKTSPKWPQLTWRTALAILRAVGLPPIMLIIVYGMLTPFFKTSGGRNHNLQFLDPSTRRSLSPQQPVDLESLGLARHAKNIPEHALIPFLPLSLYVPNAGFLWDSDSQGIASSQIEEARELTTAAYFSDPIGRRYPWAFEQPDAPWR
ncbi:hypothetical protein F5Y10DRAFT_288108 [Nemania abortiva]|nr:hypothetical protein F5Y10DRAFT_288108 [Nemania abortiva]